MKTDTVFKRAFNDALKLVRRVSSWARRFHRRAR